MMSTEQLRGLILEEVIAKLLSSSGYRLLLSEDEDENLEAVGAGLALWGRGAKHQADALGELIVPTPFSFPTRLFVEAKAYQAGSRVGLDVIRNALGVVNDVNERHVQSTERTKVFRPVRRYVYRYAVFSTSGFTYDAQTYALAQQISLIDLSSDGFAALRDLVFNAAQDLSENRGVEGLTMAQVRAALRSALSTGPDQAPSAQAQTFDEARAAAEEQAPNSAELAVAAADIASGLEESLVLGFPQAPFILALQPDDIAEFNAFLDGNGNGNRVRIEFAADPNGSGEWVISTTQGQPLARFGLPALFDTWLVGNAGPAAETPNRFLEQSLTSITFYRPQGPAALSYESTPLDAVPALAGTGFTERTSPFRQARRSASPRTRPSASDSDSWPDPVSFFADEPAWPAEATRALMILLNERYWPQAQVMRLAAGSDGRLSRADVYLAAGYDPDRLLTGFTRPIRRLTQELIDEGTLAADAPWPLQAWFPRPGRAACFLMPPSVAHAIITQTAQGEGSS